ncbi:amidohydrolase [Alcanivorax sp. ZXX171]|nr:amidohydrolase [Alcanivorax sp. ZXX171]
MTANETPCGCGGCTTRGAIDIHAHYFPQRFLDHAAKAGAEVFEAHGQPAVRVGPLFTGPIARRFIDLDLRIADMDDSGVEKQILSLTQPMVYWPDRVNADRLSRTYNDALADAHLSAPDRLFGFATLPMQFPELAMAEARRVATLPGIKGVYLGTAITDDDLGDRKFWPVYAVLEELGLPVFLHPLKVLGMTDRLSQYFLSNLLGNPFDTAVAAAHLIFSGVLDAFPALRVALPHGGGALPFLLGRISHGWSVRPECVHLDTDPRDYATRFFYDTITHDAASLNFLVEQVGVDRIMMGSDYCFDMGLEQPRMPVEKMAHLDDADKARILGGTASRLLNL